MVLVGSTVSPSRPTCFYMNVKYDSLRIYPTTSVSFASLSSFSFCVGLTLSFLPRWSSLLIPPFPTGLHSLPHPHLWPLYTSWCLWQPCAMCSHVLELGAADENEYVTFVFLGLDDPTHYNLFQAHPFTCTIHDFIFLYSWTPSYCATFLLSANLLKGI